MFHLYGYLFPNLDDLPRGAASRDICWFPRFFWRLSDIEYIKDSNDSDQETQVDEGMTPHGHDAILLSKQLKKD